MSDVFVLSPSDLEAIVFNCLRAFHAEQGESPQSDWMTHREAATYLRTEEARLYQMVSAKQVPFHKMGKSNRFSRKELDSWLLDSV